MMDIIQNRIDQVLQLQQLLFSEGTNTVTPISVAREMINDYPSKILKDPKSTYVDKHCGIGTELIAIVERLNKELRPVIKNDNDRIKHIIENQIFGWEIDTSRYQSTVTCLKEIAGTDVAVNIKNSNVLENEEYFQLKQFTLDVGNPPFNEENGSAREESGNSNNSVLYTSFVKLGFSSKHAKLIIPAGWIMKEKDVLLFKENGLKSVKFKPSSTFPDVIIRSGITIVEFEKGFKSDILITTTSGDSYYQSREEQISDISLGVKTALSKIWSYKNLSSIVKKGDYLIPKGSKGSIDRLLAASSEFSENETTEKNVRVLVYSGGDTSEQSFVYTADNKSSTDEFKVTWSVASQLYTLGKVTIVEPGTGVSNANYYIACKTMKEAKRWKTWLDHEFVKISVRFRKTNDKVSTYNNCMNYIPYLPSCGLDIKSLCEYFALDQNDYDALSPHFR